MTNIGKGRLLRVCDICGGVDDHPRHVIAGSQTGVFVPPSPEVIRYVIANAPKDEADRLLAELVDTSSQDRHMDCCREAGCPDGSCHLVAAGAEEKRGAALLAHLVKLQARDIAPDDDQIVKAEGE